MHLEACRTRDGRKVAGQQKMDAVEPGRGADQTAANSRWVRKTAYPNPLNRRGVRYAVSMATAAMRTSVL